MDDIKIRNFLQLNKFNIERTKEKIDMYYTIRTLIPAIFENSNPKLPYMKSVFENTYAAIHPKLVDGLHRVYFLKAKKPNTLNLTHITKLWCHIYEIRLYEDCMVDDIMIIDMSTITLSDVKKITPTLLIKFLAVYKKVYSLRLKNLIYLNCPTYVSILLPLMKAVMKPKIFDRVKLCPDTSILHDFFDQESLFKDYGGDGPSLEELNGTYTTGCN